MHAGVGLGFFFSINLAVHIFFSSLFVLPATVTVFVFFFFLRHCNYVHLYCLTESDDLPYLLLVVMTENPNHYLHS